MIPDSGIGGLSLVPGTVISNRERFFAVYDRYMMHFTQIDFDISRFRSLTINSAHAWLDFQVKSVSVSRDRFCHDLTYSPAGKVYEPAKNACVKRPI